MPRTMFGSADPPRLNCICLPANLPLLLIRFLQIGALLTVACFLYSEVCRVAGLGLPYSFPYYFIPGDMFSDVRAFWGKFQAFPQREFFTPSNGYFMYPVPLLYVFAGLFKSGHAFTLFLFALVTLTGLTVYTFARVLRRAGVAGPALAFFICSTVLLSYPLAFLYLRLNIEILIFVVTSLGILLWWHGRHNAAAICFGLVGACKIYPFILLGLLFAQRRYRAVALGVSVGVGLTLLTLWLLGPTVRQAYLWDAFQIGLFQKRFAGLVSHVGYDHSFLGLIKVATLPWRPELTRWVPVYTRIAAALAVLLYFARIVRLPRFNQLLALSILAITLPPVSFDYTLLALYPAFAVLCMFVVRSTRSGVHLSTDVRPHLALLAITFTPLSFVIVGGAPYGAQIRCMCLIGLLWLAIQRPLVEPALSSDLITEPAH